MTVDSSELLVGKSTQHGLVVRLCGRFTMTQSRSFLDLVCRSLDPDPGITVVIDLAYCEFLDSTFLGCLVKIHKQFPARVLVGANDQTTHRLFSSCPLQSLFRMIAMDNASVSELQRIELPAQGTDKQEFGQHILHCHRQLAALPGPMQEAFGRVVDQLERELNSQN